MQKNRLQVGVGKAKFDLLTIVWIGENPIWEVYGCLWKHEISNRE